MAGTSWLVDSRRIATKIKSASSAGDPKRVTWKSDPTRACPNCNHIIDNSDVSHEWPGLPRGVKFDPSDQEIIWHLLSKVGYGNEKPHPFIDEFIPTVHEDDGICYAHPQNLPGVKQDGSVSHFFHRAIKAYNTGTRKRRKIHGDDQGDVRWHKTGRTKPVMLDGIQRGCKKIMVLYLSTGKGGKPEKTNWVMHQYHLGTGEDENDGEFIVSKVFYQQQGKPGDKVEQELPLEITETIIAKVDPVTPKSVIPEPRRTGKHHSDVDHVQEHVPSLVDISDQNSQTEELDDAVLAGWDMLNDQANQRGEDNDNQLGEDFKLFEGESQLVFDSQQLLDSQQLAEQISICKDFFSSQTSNADGDGDGNGDGDGDERKMKPCLSDYSCMGADALKKDLEECGKLGGTVPQNNDKRKIVEQDLDCPSLATFDPSNIELDTPPDFRLSQLEFGSQDSFIGRLLNE